MTRLAQVRKSPWLLAESVATLGSVTVGGATVANGAHDPSSSSHLEAVFMEVAENSQVAVVVVVVVVVIAMAVTEMASRHGSHGSHDSCRSHGSPW